MVSPDVESLFINIPLNETINNCVSDFHKKNLYNGATLKSLRSLKYLFNLLEAATRKSSMIVKNFRLTTLQTNSRSDNAFSLSNSYLGHYEKEWLDNCRVHFKPIIWKRYVDDIFALFSSREHLQVFVDYINIQRKCLTFTSEAEKIKFFPFL